MDNFEGARLSSKGEIWNEYNKWMKDGAPIPATTVRDMKKARKEQVSLEPYNDDSYQHTNCNQPEHPQLRPLSSFDWDSEYLLNINGPNNSEAEKGSAEEDEEDEEDEGMKMRMLLMMNRKGRRKRKRNQRKTGILEREAFSNTCLIMGRTNYFLVPK